VRYEKKVEELRPMADDKNGDDSYPAAEAIYGIQHPAFLDDIL
jgi:hypothetical protein